MNTNVHNVQQMIIESKVKANVSQKMVFIKQEIQKHNLAPKIVNFVTQMVDS